MASLLAALAAKQAELEDYVRSHQKTIPLYGSSRTSGVYRHDPVSALQAQAMQATGNEELDPNDSRSPEQRAEAAAYSEGKLQEQRTGELAPTGDAYSDTRLREQLGMPSAAAKPAHPLENYLGAVSSQDEYRPAMLQYLASGGKRPKWFTGNFEVDKPNIEMAISATMTPKEQQIRQESQQKALDFEEARQARIKLAQEAEDRKTRESAQKREGLQAKTLIPNRDDRLQALQVLGGVLGENFGGMDSRAQDAAAARAASIAKAKMGTEEAKGVDLESLLSDAYNEMISKGELRMPEKGSFFGLVGSAPAGFTPKGTASQGQVSSQPSKGQAPASAVEYLKTHPELKEAFKAKYGYLP